MFSRGYHERHEPTLQYSTVHRAQTDRPEPAEPQSRYHYYQYHGIITE